MQRVTEQQLGVGVIVGLAAASYEPDIGSRLFHERFRRRLDEAFEARLFAEKSTPMAPDDVHAIRQAYIQRAQGSGREG